MIATRPSPVRTRTRTRTRALARTHLALPLVLLWAAGASAFAPAERDPSGRFLNLAGPIAQAGPTVTWPFFLRRAIDTLRGRSGLPHRVANDGAFLRENATHSTPTATWIGHATTLIQIDHVSFLTDPIWSERASPVGFAGPKRLVPPGIEIDALPAIDFVLISHSHYDHLDLPTLQKLAKRNNQTRFVAPLGNGHLLREAGIMNIQELDWGQSVTLGTVVIHCLPSQHWSQRGLFDNRKSLWASYAVVGPSRRIYFAGDTGYFPEMAKIGDTLGPFDLAVLPIGAYRPEAMMRPWHLDPEEAVRAGHELRASRLLAIHYGTFDLSDEPPDEPPARFRTAGLAAGFAEEELLRPQIGETRAIAPSP